MEVKRTLIFDNRDYPIANGKRYLFVSPSSYKEVEIITSEQVKILSYNVGVNVPSDYFNTGDMMKLKMNLGLGCLGEAYLHHFESLKDEKNDLLLLDPAGSDPSGIEKIVDFFIEFNSILVDSVVLFITWKDYTNLFEPNMIESFRLDAVKSQRLSDKNHFRVI